MTKPFRPRVTRPVPDVLSPETENALRKTDSYRKTWEDYISTFSPEHFLARQERIIRRHAIETGILERLYDISWGVTQSLVADGITSDVYERASENANELANPTALETIEVQLSALQMMVEFVQSSRDFTSGFIKELHASMTKNQKYVDGSEDQFGNRTKMPLRHGEWKLTGNSVTRPDGSLWAFVDPMFVQDEIEFLVSEYAKKSAISHPIVLAAWVHYSFINIHPFSDGNGRVARALTLFALLRGHYPPIVVARDSRSEYIAALDRGNEGDLEPLIRFFARLEENTLLGELDSVPVQVESSASVADLAKAFASRLNEKAESALNEKRFKAEKLALELQSRIKDLLEASGAEVSGQMQLPSLDFRAWVDSAQPPEPKSKYYAGQIIVSARAVGFYSNHTNGTWWSCLSILVNGKKMKFVAVVQKVGHGESGVLAVTVSAEEYFASSENSASDERSYDDLLRVSSTDWVNMSSETPVHEVWPEVKAFIDKMLFAALAEFFNRAH
jgi:Fic family protein